MNNPAPPLTPEQFAERFSEIHPPLGGQAAVVEANRCLYCFDAPCTVACPTHIDVPRFIKKIATGNLRGSAMTILDSNILGLSCSRVCPVDVLCEGACVMHRYNKQPIQIGRLQRHAMDYFYDRGLGLPAPEKDNGKRVACIGAGPASLSCAAALRGRGYQVTVFDSRELAGGLNTYGVAEYKFRPADSLKEVELVKSLGVEFRLGVEVGTAVTVEELERDYHAIFIGVGLGPTHPLRIPGEDLAGVVDALSFIAAYKTDSASVGYSVAVIGAGNTAIDAATAAVRLGAKDVTIVYRRGEPEMPAFRYEYELAKRDGIRFLWCTQPVEICGNHAVESLRCMRMELGPPDHTGRREPRPVPGETVELPCDMVITSIGQSKFLEFLARCRGVKLDRGRVAVKRETGQTENPKYFAGGDCVNGGREVVDAVAEGKRAALGIDAWLGGN
jgi:dihydropyrimidine dehydrogenase (NAD+) subunit PreT